MDLRVYLRYIRHWWWLLFLGPILLAVPTYFWTKRIAPTYRATTIIFVNQTEKPDAVTYNDALLNQQLVKTYALMAQQPVVLDDASHVLGYPIDGGVTTLAIQNTQLLQISADGSTPTRARDIANAVAEVFIRRQAVTFPADQTLTGLQVAQPALIPTHPVAPKRSLNLMIAVVVGFALAVGIAKLLEYLGTTIKSSDDLGQAVGLDVLGTVGFLRRDERSRLEMLRRASSTDNLSIDWVLSLQPAPEAYHRVRTALEFALSRRRTSEPPFAFCNHVCETVLVASANADEGRSTTVANIATAMAQANKRVIIIDADLRRPTQHRLFDVENINGLSRISDGQEYSDTYILPTQIDGLRVLPAGSMLLDSARVRMPTMLDVLLAQLRMQADIILIDSPAVLAVSDALQLAKHADGIILVADATRTRVPQLIAAAEELDRTGTPLLGVVLNKCNAHPLRGLTSHLHMHGIGKGLHKSPRRRVFGDDHGNDKQPEDDTARETVAFHGSERSPGRHARIR